MFKMLNILFEKKKKKAYFQHTYTNPKITEYTFFKHKRGPINGKKENSKSSKSEYGNRKEKRPAKKSSKLIIK